MKSLIAVLRGITPPADAQPAPVPMVEKAPLSSLSVISKLDEHLKSPEQRPRFRAGIHPSEISHEDPFCARWHVFRRELVTAQQEGRALPFNVTEVTEENPVDGDLMRIFEMGHAVHEMYQNRLLGRAGVLYGFWERWNASRSRYEQERGFRPEGEGWRYVEPVVRTKGIRGHCDGIVCIDGRWLALEIKSTNDQAFTYRKSVKQEHLRQAMLYAHLGFVDFPEIEVEGIVFLYVNKNTSKEMEFIVPKDTSIIQDILDGLDTLERADRQEHLPPRQCVRANSKRANSCPVKDYCFSVGSGKEALIQIQEAAKAH